MTANYSLVGMTERAADALVKNREYVEGLLSNYAARCVHREKNHLVPIGVCGMGRAGKDTAAEFLCTYTKMTYPQSLSTLALPVVADIIGIDPAVAFAERHQHREFWIAACHAIRATDFDMLIRMALGCGDIAVGIRGRLELDAAVHKGTVHLTLWIDNPRVPPDPTVEYGPGDCDLIIPNYGSLLEFYSKLRRFITMMQRGAFSIP